MTTPPCIICGETNKGKRSTYSSCHTSAVMSPYHFSAVLFILALFKVGYEANASSSFCMISYATQYPPSLYRQYCCLPGNNGKTIEVKENNRVKIIMCPTTGLPHTSCPAHSCSEALELFPSATSGYYNITQSNGSIVSVYCDMDGSNCDGNGGWMRVGYVNMTEPGATCPQGLYNYTIGGKTLCDRIHTSSGRCDVTFFASNGLNYTKVCGRVRGYELGAAPDSIYPNHGAGSPNIDGVYVDGVSITHGSNPRQHIWTYTAGHAEDSNDAFGACPCITGYTGQPTPSYVGNDYYCEAGTTQSMLSLGTLYPNDPLWDGQQCNYLETPCCTSPQMPFFVKSLNQSITNDIEFRMCSSEGYPDEATPIDIVELYVR